MLEAPRRRSDEVREYDNAVSTVGDAVQILTEVYDHRQLWEAHATLASAYDTLRRQSEAREQWAAATGIIRKQANDLSRLGLREGFLNAPPIGAIFAKAEA